MKRQLFPYRSVGGVVTPLTERQAGIVAGASSLAPTMSTIGILGAGKVGTTLARLTLAAGHDVVLAGSPRQPMQALIVETLVPGSRLLPEAEVVEAADIVVVAIPFGKADSIDWDALSGKVVVDAMNHWYAVDGDLPELDAHDGPTVELTLRRNPAMRVVRSLNHLGYHDMETDARPAGHPLRRALVVAADDEEARDQVARYVDDLGFDPVLAPLAATGVIDGDGAAFGIEMSAVAMVAAVDEHAGAGTARRWGQAVAGSGTDQSSTSAR